MHASTSDHRYSSDSSCARHGENTTVTLLITEICNFLVESMGSVYIYTREWTFTKGEWGGVVMEQNKIHQKAKISRLHRK